MTSVLRHTYPAWRIAADCVLIAGLAAGLTSWLGCRQGEAPGPAQPETTAEQLAAQVERKIDAAIEGIPADRAGPLPEGLPSAQEVLNSMVGAYKGASTYQDTGYVEGTFRLSGRPQGDKASYMVALARPNKIRVQAYAGLVVSDGQKLWASLLDLPDQVLRREAPAEVTVASIYPERNLVSALASGPTQVFTWLPVQLVLLLADDPLKTLLHQSEEPAMLRPDKIGQRECYRVQYRREEGTGVLWIDRETYVLRRMEVPADALRAALVRDQGVRPDQIQEFSLVVEFEDARLNGPIDPNIFEFQVPDDAQVVEAFFPPDVLWLGQSPAEFSFVDLDGNPVTPQWLADKIAVIDFWATWCEPCRISLPGLEQAYQKYKENEKVVFRAVSIDLTTDTVEQPRVEDDALREMFKQLGVTVPIARDPEQSAYRAFKIQGVPTTVILGPDGLVHYRKTGGGSPDVIAAQLTEKLDGLLAGGNIYEDVVQSYKKAYEAQKKQFEQMLEQSVENDLYAFTQQEIPRAEIAERTEPRSLKMSQLWSCTELPVPGNILVVEQPDGPPRLFVLKGVFAPNETSWIAEIGVNGAVVSKKDLGVPPTQPVLLARTAAGADGKRYFAGTAMGSQQVHLWDADFNLVFSFPQDALQNPHSGISDVRLADFGGDGTLGLAVGYFGVVGVQGVSLEGERTWANKSVVQSMRLDVLAPDPQGRRGLLCINNPVDGTPTGLVVLDAKGQREREFQVANRSFVWIAAADLDGDGRSEICGLAPTEAGNIEALGLSLEGRELWSHPLPRGMHEHQIEAVIAGKLFANQPQCWLLAGADGTIRIVDPSGKLLDQFAYGAPLTGLATAQWDAKHVLLVSTPGSVDAWEVEPPAAP